MKAVSPNAQFLFCLLKVLIAKHHVSNDKVSCFAKRAYVYLSPFYKNEISKMVNFDICKTYIINGQTFQKKNPDQTLIENLTNKTGTQKDDENVVSAFFCKQSRGQL